MDNFDFDTQLLNLIKKIPDLPMNPKISYVDEDESLVVYPLPGGVTVRSWYDGSSEMRLPFQVMIQTKDQELAYKTLWLLSNEIPKFKKSDFNADSWYLSDGGISITNQPSLNDKDEHDFYICVLEIEANILFEGE